MSIYENTSAFDELRNQFQQGDMVVKLIIFNVGTFLFVNLFYLFAFLFQGMGWYTFFMDGVMVPASLRQVLLQPWSLFTYMFLHEGFMHVLFNMIILYTFGRILHSFLGNRKILPVYVLGGLAGALVYIISFNLFPAFRASVGDARMLGASAGVMSVMLAAATLKPNYSIMLIFLGEVKIKYIAFFFVFLDIVTIAKENPGGHLAHLGGALFGFLFIQQLQNGSDWSTGFNKMADQIVSAVKGGGTGSKPKVAYKNTDQVNSGRKAAAKKGAYDDEKQAKVDSILDKIRESGYDSLSKEEKDYLFKLKDD